DSKERAASCTSLSSLRLAAVKFTGAISVTTPASIEITPPFQLPADTRPFCRVTATIIPTADSQIGVEIWLPPPQDWNGKFKGVGSGGLGGAIPHDALAAGLERRYATAATDTGHDNRGGAGLFSLGHPERII